MSEGTKQSFRPELSRLPFGPATILLGAGALVAYGVTRKSKLGAVLATAGGALAYACTRSNESHRPEESTHATLLVNTSPERAYDLWRDFENLPRFMAHLKSVRTLDGGRSEWVARGPLDREVRWTAQMTEDSPNRLVGWRSEPGSDVDTSGTVTFRPDPQGRGTFVSVNLQYSVPGGILGRAFAALFGKHPEFVVREDLRRFKALLEAGEAPTTVGQTHGPRGIHGAIERGLFRETSNHLEPQAASGLQQAA